jgi:hypothetical protein
MATNGTIGGCRGVYTIEKVDPHQGINNNHAGQIVTIYWR